MIQGKKDVIIDSDENRQLLKDFFGTQRYKRSTLKKVKRDTINSIENSSSLNLSSLEKISDFVINKFRDELNLIKEEQKQELVNTANQIFDKAEFAKNFEESMIRLIQEEVKSQIGCSNIHAIIKDIVLLYVKDNLKTIVSEIINSFVSKMNQKLTYELKVTKELTYSIDAEIRHTLMDLPISYSTEQIIKEKINGLITNLFVVKNKLDNNLKMLE